MYYGCQVQTTALRALVSILVSNIYICTKINVKKLNIACFRPCVIYGCNEFHAVGVEPHCYVSWGNATFDLKPLDLDPVGDENNNNNNKKTIELYTHHMSLLFPSFHQLFLNSALVNSFCCKN